ncbi:MAG: 2-hydroxychromene-2-carboxylate isomerase [Hyphomicrobiales bacterium]|nr:2-hydroxychromene-2-carboxylate isomerase [Hyphomicrobiales bacterium]
MSRSIDYYFTMVSPWAYIGDALFKSIARKHKLTIDYRPVNLGRLFPNSGGLPLGQRHPLRRQYRLIELQRWREKRGLDFAIQPNNWPFDPTLADCCALALTETGADPSAFVTAGFRTVFERELGLADPDVIATVLRACNHDADAILAAAQTDRIKQAYEGNYDRAIAAGVFGSPSFVLDGEVFWGQDRLETLEDALKSGRKAFTA